MAPASARAHAGLAGIAAERGDSKETVARYRKAIEADPTNPRTHSALLYNLHYLDEYVREALFREHMEWARRFAGPLRAKIRPHRIAPMGNRRLRIGYVSPDLREHTVTKFITAALQYHDAEQFEITCYSDTAAPDAVTEKLKTMVEHWRETAGTSDEALDDLIRGDAIDILVDLRGHGGGNRSCTNRGAACVIDCAAPPCWMAAALPTGSNPPTAQ